MKAGVHFGTPLFNNFFGWLELCARGASGTKPSARISMYPPDGLGGPLKKLPMDRIVE
jgi:hypothetical protein